MRRYLGSSKGLRPFGFSGSVSSVGCLRLRTSPLSVFTVSSGASGSGMSRSSDRSIINRFNSFWNHQLMSAIALFRSSWSSSSTKVGEKTLITSYR